MIKSDTINIRQANMKNKKVVVTGGAGFIGSNLCLELSKDNHVIIFDDLSSGFFKNIEDLTDKNNVDFVKGTINDISLLQKTFKDVDYVFHQAAIASVVKSIADPVKSNYVNVDGTLNVLIAARDNEVNKVIQASSSSIYGDTTISPETENILPSPLSPYAIGKLAGEYYCKIFNETYNLATTSLRYYNVYGPNQDPTSEYAAVIPIFITKILKNESPIIYGDGEQTRDFVYVKDVVNANILAAESNAIGVFNIANGKTITINELAKLIMKIYNKNLKLIYKDVRPGDVKHSLADVSKSKEKLNYEPKFDLESGLKETIEWLQTQKQKK